MGSITRLQYFNVAVELGSISAASKHFDVQPSSISRQLVALEDELGVRLLSRTTRNIGLTEAGRKYHEYSQRIVSELDEAKRAVNDLQENPKGVLKLNMTVGFGDTIITPLIPLFMDQYPDIKVDIDLTERVVDLIEENIDVAIRSGRLTDSTLVAKHLADNNFILCASPQYISKNGMPKSPDALKDHACIKYGYAGWQDWYEMLDSPKKLNINSNITVNSVSSQKQLLLGGAGLALTPYWSVKHELKSKQLVQLLRDHTFSPYESLTSTYAIYVNRKLVAPKVRVFLDFIAQHIHV